MSPRTARIAKLTPPGTHHVVDRARLHDLLDSRRSKAVCWLAGPPGSGKTALAASYLAHSASAGLWMQIDPGDNDPATFFYFLRLAALKLRPKSARHLPLLTPEYFADMRGFARSFFRKLAAILPSRSLVIFDDWHKLAADSIMHDLLEVAIAEAPLDVRFMVASRIGPAELFARLLANGQLLVLGWDALRARA